MTIPEYPELKSDLLWESYRTSRAESVAAQQSMQRVVGWSMTVGTVIIAGLGFSKTQMSSTSMSSLLAPIMGWAVIAALDLLAVSQYLGELGRMLRAGYYARQLERIIWRQMGPKDLYSSKFLWEGFLTLKKRRLHWTYRLAMPAPFGVLIMTQVAPFVIFKSPLHLYAVAIAGILVSICLIVTVGKTYLTRFPPEDAEDSDPIQALLGESKARGGGA